MTVQGQGHSKGSKCWWMFVRMIFSELQNIFLPNLVWWCSIMSQNVKRKKIVCYLQGQGNSKGSCDLNLTPFYYIFWTWQPSLVWWYIIKSQSVLWKNWVTVSRWRAKMSVFVQMIPSTPPNIFEPKLVLWCITASQSAWKKIGLLFSRSRS